MAFDQPPTFRTIESTYRLSMAVFGDDRLYREALAGTRDFYRRLVDGDLEERLVRMFKKLRDGQA